MSTEELLAKYSPDIIKLAAQKLKTTERIRKQLLDSRWNDTPLVLENKTFLIPPLDDDRRPLAVTLHHYGVYIEPIYTQKNGGKPDNDFALFVNEEDEGLVVRIEDAFSLTISGSYELGFRVEVTETDKKTKIIDTTPKYR